MLKVIAKMWKWNGIKSNYKMKIEKIFKKLNIPVSIHHTSIGAKKKQKLQVMM